MSTDGVSTAFEMILEEIELIVSEVNSQGAAFLRNNDYLRAKDAIAAGEKLAAFQNKLGLLKDEWVTGLDEAVREQVQVEPMEVARTIAAMSKSQKTVLVVKFGDGAVIYEDTAAETFTEAIKKFGVQRVVGLGLKVNNFPLVSKNRCDSYSQTSLDSYFIMTHSNTLRLANRSPNPH